MKRIRVLIVEDSAVVREHLKRIIAADRRLEVAGAVATAEEALEVLEEIAPDVISMDVRLPGIQGLDATRQIMARRPTPIVVVSAVEPGEMNLTMEAFKAGALAVVEKPPAVTQAGYDAVACRLCTQLAIMSEVVVVRQQAVRPRPVQAPDGCCRRGNYRIVGMAASTGGPNALMQVLGSLGSGFPLPVLLVQHMEPSFVVGFGSWLAGVTGLKLEIVDRRMELAPGTLYLAAPDRHLVTDGSWAWAQDGERVSSHRPSASVLFEAMALHVGQAAIGILLTGMGEDGAQGLRQLRLAGGYTVAEHQSTAVVYGMPAAAVRLGAACESLALHDVAPRLMKLAGGDSQDPSS
ncbi:MAG TPA: chemotaxis protein CheB [Bryobacteraceae bacterium]|nr:chemotaxis protein CheB [Bryobacteraceae bacterium]